MPSILPRTFYSRSALEVAPELLGKVLCHRRNGVTTRGKIVEVEAYLGETDPASHAYRGITPRNRVMFGSPGFAYVYFTYGNHYCMNVVTGQEGEGSAVLIRALEPVDGIPAMKRRRKKTKLVELTSGPGKLAQAMGINLKQYGFDLTHPPLWIEEAETALRWKRTPRIGISNAVHKPYRFVVLESRFVSRP